LKEVAVTTIELDLESDIRAVADARDVELPDVDWNASESLARCLEERNGEWQLDTSRRDVEDAKVRRVLVDGDKNGGCPHRMLTVESDVPAVQREQASVAHRVSVAVAEVNLVGLDKRASGRRKLHLEVCGCTSGACQESKCLEQHRHGESSEWPSARGCRTLSDFAEGWPLRTSVRAYERGNEGEKTFSRLFTPACSFPMVTV